ncbi:hypothetical protein IMF27_09450 [Pseudomonas sp. PCH199]|uniref:hypothetical protein n=1 Tax=unclassified Pseudomonas TaxID=196821 RepID=UPI000BCF7534|nr:MULTISPECIES: hypothetical protein [unclassified Pseudomonas]MCW8275893.1 hypothetical protein [Pseudomonas sp. PCH199]PAM83965.1 hypothetical protein CES87_09685 [Pseudomonas sp. ERMR1:02]
MMGENFWSSWTAFWLAGSTFVLDFLFLAFNFYLSRRYLDAMIEALPNSRYLYLWETYWKNFGWFGRFWLMNKIAAMVVWPSTHIRWGNVDLIDLQNIPPHLKRLIRIHSILLYGAGIWMLVSTR